VIAPGGEQYPISGGGYTATVTESGGTLRSLVHGERPLIDGFAEDAMASGGRGQLLMPWPNRIRDGRYSFDGSTYQLGLSEAGRHNASHGLARWAAWSPVTQQADTVTLGYRIVAQSGYPWTLDLRVTYALDGGGLTVTQSATNRASTPAPYASGAHPYLTVGAGPVDDWTLRLPGSTRLLTDADRKLPLGRERVAGTPYDFRDARPVGDVVLDHAFTDLERDAAGRAVVSLTGPGGTTRLWVDEGHPWLMAYTADDSGTPRRSLAIEPMTAPVDAFNSGEDLVRLEPGATHTVSWGIQAG